MTQRCQSKSGKHLRDLLCRLLNARGGALTCFVRSLTIDASSSNVPASGAAQRGKELFDGLAGCS